MSEVKWGPVLRGMQWGPEGGTRKEKSRHRSYCDRHGYMTWEEYISKPNLRGERKKKARAPRKSKAGILGRIGAWLKMLRLSVG